MWWLTAVTKCPQTPLSGSLAAWLGTWTLIDRGVRFTLDSLDLNRPLPCMQCPRHEGSQNFNQIDE